ncbi:metal/formaldehyde-sensitive transcriptional repressor [Janthinobacterium sp. GMG1]|uniref:metal/formaldehyde-sensitive transcriptional repressor n=1 Tax=Janthinobacterium sp. GMG1 TaxID=3096007 RepID=UPI002ACA4860|nr:metal/formaldehyde-sensitive transcriptional repressor [Janthinobacterium sp. GMG1]MDZ5636114.1 metal/formaldehyde-sensitive transcriptional repressor [Janthinobacterium sp. GMG1]
MGHTAHHKTKLLNRVKRIRGQVESLERGLEEGRDCGEVLQLIAAVRGAVNGLMAEVIEEHLREHVASPDISGDERARGADDIAGILRTYLK